MPFALHNQAAPKGREMKGLIIRKHWLDKILAGTKTWEMRSQKTSYRGPIALICQGTGGQILGIAELVDSLPAVTDAEFSAARRLHGIPPEDDARVLEDRWIYPWVLRNVRPLQTLVLSGQRPGQVIWVPIAPATAARIEEQLASCSSPRREAA